MSQRGVGDFFSAQHAGNLAHPRCVLQWGDFAGGALGIAAFGDHQVVICASGHLGQMGDGHHLAITSELLHQATHGFCHSATYARVNLIKDQGLRASQLAGRDRNGQSDA